MVWCTAASSGLLTLATSMPTERVLPPLRRRLLAVRLWRYPSRSMALRTRELSSSDTPGSPLTTRDTVFKLVPASAATSRIVGRGMICGTSGTIDNVGPKISLCQGSSS